MASDADREVEATPPRLAVVSSVLVLANLFSVYLVEQMLEENLGAGSWLFAWAFLVGLANTAFLLSIVFSVFRRSPTQRALFVIGAGALIVELLMLALFIPATHFA